MRLAQSMQEDLRQIGVRLALKPVDFPALIEAVRHPGVVPLFLLGWEADFPDPSNFLTVLLHSRSRDTNTTPSTRTRSGPHPRRGRSAARPRAPVRALPRRRGADHAGRALGAALPPAGSAVRHPRVRGYELHPLRPSRVERVWLAW